MGKKGQQGGGKAERRAAKQSANRSREHRKEARRALDRSELAQFAVALKGHGLALKEVEGDGNCFFRSLADQIENCEHNHAEYREKVMDYVEQNAADFEPFFSFGEGEDEEDADFGEYVTRMRRECEWAGQYEIIAAARALGVHIMVHQFKAPAYRIDDTARPDAPTIHVSYHDGDHYNSVRDPTSAVATTSGAARGGSASAAPAASATGDVDAASEELRGLALDGGETAKKRSKEERRTAKAAASRAREQGEEPAAAAADVRGSGGGGGGGGGGGEEEDGEGGGGGGGEEAEGEAEHSTLEQKRLDKAMRKEEKRLRKEQRDRERAAFAAKMVGDEPPPAKTDWTNTVISM